MLTVHHLGISQSDRIVWLCEELEIPYQLLRYERHPDTKLTPESYRALHPSWTAPVITDAGMALAESGAIIEYIIGKYGQGRLKVGPESPEFANYLYWLHYANGSMMCGGMLDFVLTLLQVDTDNETVRDLRGRYDRGFTMAEQRLGAAPYFAGLEFTAADIIMFFPLTTMRLFTPRDLSPYPNIRAYLQRVAARPAYRRAMEKADPDLRPALT